MASFSGRVIGTLILGHFLTTRAGRPGRGSALERATPFAAAHIHPLGSWLSARERSR